MPKRTKKRVIASSSTSPNKTPSPRKKSSPLKKLVLRRTSQTPERITYQVVARIPSTTAISKTTAPFLEESFDEKTPSPPKIHQRNENKAVELKKKSLNCYGLEESADDESETEQEEKEKMNVIKKLTKKRSTPKNSQELRSKIVEAYIDRISPSFNMQLLDAGIEEGPEIIGNMTAIMGPSQTSSSKPKSIHGIEEERVESPLTSTKDESTEDILGMDDQMDIEIVNVENQVQKKSREKSSKLKKISKSGTNILSVSVTKDESPLPSLGIEEERVESPLNTSNEEAAAEISQSYDQMDVEFVNDENQDTVSHQNKYYETFSNSKSDSKRSSKSGIDVFSPVTKAESPETPPNTLSKFKSSKSSEKRNESSTISEGEFEMKIEVQPVKFSVDEELTNLKVEDNGEILKSDQYLDTVLNTNVEKTPKSKAKKKTTSKIQEETSLISPKHTVVEKLTHLKIEDSVETVQDECQDTVSNMMMDEKSERKSTPKPISNDSILSPKLPMTPQDSFQDSMDIENIEPKPTVPIFKQELPTTSKNNKNNIPKFSSSPFTFTPEQLERFKSQQQSLPPHQPLPNGYVAVKLVPQNRSCAPAFIQISQKDFHRMLPKLPQQQTNDEMC